MTLPISAAASRGPSLLLAARVIARAGLGLPLAAMRYPFAALAIDRRSGAVRPR